MSEDGFLSRWSRRKREIAAAERARAAREEAEARDAAREAALASSETPGEPPSEGAGAAAAVSPPSVSEAEAETMSDEEVLARLDLPHPDSIATTEQARAFLRGGVPGRLQRLALRRMWAVTPDSQLACFDGLRDYADDYTDAALGAGSVTTTYAVGQGLRAHVEALARQAEEALRAKPAGKAGAEAPEGAGAAAPESASVASRDAAAGPETGKPTTTPEPVAIAARPHVRPPEPPRADSARPPRSRDETDRSKTGAHDQSPIPDENASRAYVADAAPHHELGAATEPKRPRRMVFRYENE